MIYNENNIAWFQMFSVTADPNTLYTRDIVIEGTLSWPCGLSPVYLVKNPDAKPCIQWEQEGNTLHTCLTKKPPVWEDNLRSPYYHRLKVPKTSELDSTSPDLARPTNTEPADLLAEGNSEPNQLEEEA